MYVYYYHADPFVRLCLVFAGKKFSKRKIASTQHVPSLVFNEPLYFEVPRDKLERVKILIVVIEDTIWTDPDADSAFSEENEIGKILLGRNCLYNAHMHWKEMIHAPRIQIAEWYPIFQELWREERN